MNYWLGTERLGTALKELTPFGALVIILNHFIGALLEDKSIKLMEKQTCEFL